jgi:hypothetical protein
MNELSSFRWELKLYALPSLPSVGVGDEFVETNPDITGFGTTFLAFPTR